MNYENIVNEDLRIAAIHIADLDIGHAAAFLCQWEAGATLKELTLYYDQEEDYLVLNQDNKKFDFYKKLAEAYLGSDAKKREKLMQKAPESIQETIQVLSACVTKRLTSTDINHALLNWIEEKYMPIVKEIGRERTPAAAASIAFRYGMMCGKREERARREKTALHR